MTPVSLASMDRPPNSALIHTETELAPPLCLQQAETLITDRRHCTSYGDVTTLIINLCAKRIKQHALTTYGGVEV